MEEMKKAQTLDSAHRSEVAIKRKGTVSCT